MRDIKDTALASHTFLELVYEMLCRRSCFVAETVGSSLVLLQWAQPVLAQVKSKNNQHYETKTDCTA